MVMFFSVRADSFLTVRNLTLLSGDSGILLLAALGATFVVVMGSIDLSVGAAVMLTGAILSVVISAGVTSPLVVVSISVAVGSVLGLVNGMIFAYGRVPSFIATLGTLSLFSGLGLTILNGQARMIDAPGVQDLAVGQLIPHVQNPALIALGVFVLYWFIGSRTRFGLYLYAIGGNEHVVQLSGVRVNRYKVLAFVASGVTVALAGLLLMARLSSSGPTAGSTTLLDALAAIVVGGTALSGGVGGVARTVLGVLIVTVLANGLNQMGVDDFIQSMVKGGVIVVAAVFTMATQRKLIIK